MSKPLTEKSERVFQSIADALQDGKMSKTFQEIKKGNAALFEKAKRTDMSDWGFSGGGIEPQIGSKRE